MPVNAAKRRSFRTGAATERPICGRRPAREAVHANGDAQPRSSWDYCDRRDEFLSWAKAAGAATRLLNSPETLRWNTDKAYLLDLASAGVPVVPSRMAGDPTELRAAAAGFSGRVVVKPCVGVGGQGVVVFDSADAVTAETLGLGPWMVQPVVEYIRTEGETSVFVLGGRPVGQVRKLATGDEIRVHEEYGGRTDKVGLDAEAARIATATVTIVQRLLSTDLTYARVDLMRLPDDTLAVSELEVTEPGLYLDVAPEHAEPLCATVTQQIYAAGLAARSGPSGVARRSAVCGTIT